MICVIRGVPVLGERLYDQDEQIIGEGSAYLCDNDLWWPVMLHCRKMINWMSNHDESLAISFASAWAVLKRILNSLQALRLRFPLITTVQSLPW